MRHLKILFFFIGFSLKTYSQFAYIVKDESKGTFPADSMYGLSTSFNNVLGHSLSKFFKSETVNLEINSTGHFVSFSTFWVENFGGEIKTYFLKSNDSIYVSFEHGKLVLTQNCDAIQAVALKKMDLFEDSLSNLIKLPVSLNEYKKQVQVIDREYSQFLSKNEFINVSNFQIFWKYQVMLNRANRILAVFDKCRNSKFLSEILNDQYSLTTLKNIKNDLLIPKEFIKGLNNYGITLDYYLRMSSMLELRLTFENKSLFDVAKKDFSNFHRDLALTRIMMSEDHNSSLLESYLEICHDPNFKNIILKKNNKVEDLLQSQILLKSKIFDFTMEKEISFKELIDSSKDKLIYIDFWASWCGACKEEVVYLDSLIYAFPNLRVITINIDSQIGRGKEALKKWKFKTSENYWIDPEGELASLLAKPSIPRYTLINQKSKAISTNAPKPSNPELYNILNK